MGLQSIPDDFQTWESGIVPLVTVAKICLSEESINFFLGSLVICFKAKGVHKGIFLLMFPKSASLASRYVRNLKFIPEGETPG